MQHRTAFMLLIAVASLAVRDFSFADLKVEPASLITPTDGAEVQAELRSNTCHACLED